VQAGNNRPLVFLLLDKEITSAFSPLRLSHFSQICTLPDPDRLAQAAFPKGVAKRRSTDRNQVPGAQRDGKTIIRQRSASPSCANV